MTTAERPIGERTVHPMRSSTGTDYVVHAQRLGSSPTAALIVTDGDAMFGLTVDSVQMLQLPGLVGDLVVVGIGYPDSRGYLDSIEPRTRDFTPVEFDWMPGGGGAPEFADFISRDLVPWIAANWPDAVDDLTYFGHSLGGLFGSWQLLDEGSPFNRSYLSSASLWWSSYWLDEQVRSLGAGGLDLGGHEIFFGIGGDETDAGRRAEARFLPDDHPFKPPDIELDMVADLGRFVATLRTAAGASADIAHRVFVDEFHATAAVRTLSAGLRQFPPRR